MQTIKINKAPVQFKITTPVLNQVSQETGHSISKISTGLLAEQDYPVVKWLMYYGYKRVNADETKPEQVDKWLEDLTVFTEVWYLLQVELEPMLKTLIALAEKKKKSAAKQ